MRSNILHEALTMLHLNLVLICWYSVVGSWNDMNPQKCLHRWSRCLIQGRILGWCGLFHGWSAFQGLIGVLEVLVTEVWFWEAKWKVHHRKWWWVLNRSKHIIIWCCGSFLHFSIICIRNVFRTLLWWFSTFRTLFCAVWHASLRVQEHWQVSAACIVPLIFVPNEFWIRML